MKLRITKADQLSDEILNYQGEKAVSIFRGCFHEISVTAASKIDNCYLTLLKKEIVLNMADAARSFYIKAASLTSKLLFKAIMSAISLITNSATSHFSSHKHVGGYRVDNDMSRINSANKSYSTEVIALRQKLLAYEVGILDIRCL